MRKLSESVWGDIRKKSLGQEDRLEDGNRKRITTLTKKVFDALKKEGFEMYDFWIETFNKISDDTTHQTSSTFYVKSKDRFNLTFMDNEFLGHISQRTEYFNYDNVFIRPDGMYLSDGMTCDTSGEKATIWFEFVDKKNLDDLWTTWNPYALYYLPDSDCWMCNNPYIKKSPDEISGCESIKKFLAITTCIMYPETKYKKWL